jgi:hypothetical protein
MLVGYLTIAFVLLMLIDAIRRGVPVYWILIIIFFAPLGAFVYFFAIKWRDFMPLLKRVFRTQPISTEKLIRLYEATPSEANELALANAFYDEQRFEQAEKLYQDVLTKQPEHTRAMLGLARVYRTQSSHSQSVDLYEKLIAADPRQDDFRVALEYSEALWDSGAKDRALEVLEDIAGETQRLNHRLALAHYLVQARNTARAREVLVQALDAHSQEPVGQQRRDKRWAKSAQKLLEKLDPHSK